MDSGVEGGGHDRVDGVVVMGWDGFFGGCGEVFGARLCLRNLPLIVSI